MCSSCVAHPSWHELYRHDSTIFPLLSPFFLGAIKIDTSCAYSTGTSEECGQSCKWLFMITIGNNRCGHEENLLKYTFRHFFFIGLVSVPFHNPHSKRSVLPTDTVALIQGLVRQTLTEEGSLCVFHTGISTWKLSLISFKTNPQFSLCPDFCLSHLLFHPPWPLSWLRVINSWFWNVIFRRFVLFLGYFCGISTRLHRTHGTACMLLCAFVWEMDWEKQSTQWKASIAGQKQVRNSNAGPRELSLSQPAVWISCLQPSLVTHIRTGLQSFSSSLPP